MRIIILTWGTISALTLLSMSDFSPLLFWKPYRDFLNSLPPQALVWVLMVCLAGLAIANGLIHSEERQGAYRQ